MVVIDLMVIRPKTPSPLETDSGMKFVVYPMRLQRREGIKSIKFAPRFDQSFIGLKYKRGSHRNAFCIRQGVEHGS